MQNITIKSEGDKLIITIDTSQEFGTSRSGKSIIVATTSGNQKVNTPNGEIVIGINAYKSRKF